MKGIDVLAFKEAINSTRDQYLTMRLGKAVLDRLNEEWDIATEALHLLSDDELELFLKGADGTMPRELLDAESDFEAFVRTSFIPVDGYRPTSFHEDGIELRRRGHLIDLENDSEWTEIIRVIVEEDATYRYEKYHLDAGGARTVPVMKTIPVEPSDIATAQKSINQLLDVLKNIKAIYTSTDTAEPS
jgi:hypothetical protein